MRGERMADLITASVLRAVEGESLGFPNPRKGPVYSVQSSDCDPDRTHPLNRNSSSIRATRTLMEKRETGANLSP